MRKTIICKCWLDEPEVSLVCSWPRCLWRFQMVCHHPHPSNWFRWWVFSQAPLPWLSSHNEPHALFSPCSQMRNLKRRKQKPAPSYTGSKWGRWDLRQVSDRSPHCYLWCSSDYLSSIFLSKMSRMVNTPRLSTSTGIIFTAFKPDHLSQGTSLLLQVVNQESASTQCHTLNLTPDILLTVSFLSSQKTV